MRSFMGRSNSRLVGTSELVHARAHMLHISAYTAHLQGHASYSIIFLRREGRELGTEACVCNPSAQEAKAGGSQVQT